MRNKLLLIALVVGFAVRLNADTTITGDSIVTGQTGVNTNAPRARLGIVMDESDVYILKVSSQDGDAMMVLDNSGNLGIGSSDPEGNVDVRGSAADGDIGIQLRVGNSSSTTSSSQVVFSYGESTSTRRHSIRSRADPTQALNNSLDFFLWNTTSTPATLGELHVLSLQAFDGAGGSSGSVHIMPFGDPTAELVVSDGSLMGGGTIQCNTVGTHSSRELKSDITYLGMDDERKAFKDVDDLQHVRFRYRSKDDQVRKGLIYEDAPRSIQGAHKTIVVDERVLNMEMTLKEVNRRIKQLEARISEMGAIK